MSTLSDMQTASQLSQGFHRINNFDVDSFDHFEGSGSQAQGTQLIPGHSPLQRPLWSQLETISLMDSEDEEDSGPFWSSSTLIGIDATVALFLSHLWRPLTAAIFTVVPTVFCPTVILPTLIALLFIHLSSCRPHLPVAAYHIVSTALSMPQGAAYAAIATRRVTVTADRFMPCNSTQCREKQAGR
ncbi:hypothetical protein GALMADRAFT_136393 [Galerina marginata CBS 339.88]|uniref:Uncharacterized protein n=1 Tax=Galerina marginata (strain CBS 339.88) TaxID=685588 RepID=A0A067T9H2_GALM3|nr:hypothetical protein GALMADRAFT_136393 [Galerina marginata CBS 339.88]